MANSAAHPIHLRGGGVSLLFGSDHRGIPLIAHWGADLGNDRDGVLGLLATSSPAVLNSSFDHARSLSVAAVRSHGWSGTPAFEWRNGARSGIALKPVDVESTASSARFRLADDAGVEVVLDYRLDDAGVLHTAAAITHTGSVGELEVGAVRMLLPLPARAAEILDFTGKWSGERRPQRQPVHLGTWSRSARRGRPGHDSAFLTLVGTPAFGFRSGEVWACHIAWSGDATQLVERLPEGGGVHAGIVGGGELLGLGEVRLAPGETYETPDVLFAWGEEGIDSVTERLHRSVRARPSHPIGPRPLVFNTWEAVYFDHDSARLMELAVRAAEIGIERFVLDDGWFRGRRNDTAGLGDWFVDDAVWPAGLTPLSDRVRELGMQFGLWFEPEMVNPDSELAREHPEWLMAEDPDLAWRHQFGLDLSHPEAYRYILERIDAVVSENRVDFIKWDHNRDLHATVGRSDGAARVHAHTLALYRLLDELGARHPEIEIESCASGGARADLGILERTQRIWASDTNDPIERQRIQRWTTTLLPPELIGAHVGPESAHTTHRAAALSFRLVTALFGHAGIEWDVTHCTPDELQALTRWAALYKELRPLLHAGLTIRADDVDEGASLHGVVADDGRHAVFAWVRTETSTVSNTPRVRIPGLDPARQYRVRVRDDVGTTSCHQVADPAWLLAADSETVLPGSLLTREGVPLTLLNPGQAMLLEFLAD